MTRRERVIKALQHETADIIPYTIDFTQQEYEKVAKFLDDWDFEEKIGNHIESVYYSGFLGDRSHDVPGKPGYVQDDFGVVWNRTGADKDIGVLDNLVLEEPDMKGFKLPEIDLDVLRQGCRQMMENGKDTFKILGIGFSMFERAWTLRGMENFLTDMLLEPDFANELLDAICEFNLKIIDIGLEFDVDAIHFGDDWGQQKGLIMGPELWRKFIKPRMARMYEKARSAGKYVSQHSCGDIHEIFPDLIDIGLNMYQTFQPEIYDIKKVKKEYGRHLAFWGGISTQKLLPYATPEEVKSKSVEIMRIVGENGGYVASPTHSVPGDVPAENIVALIDVFQNQDKYL